MQNETTGKIHIYRLGEGWFVEKGAKVLWSIPGERLVKNGLVFA